VVKGGALASHIRNYAFEKFLKYVERSGLVWEGIFIY
jgi:hypothetical protein